MKKIYIVLLLILTYARSGAQVVLSVAPGTNLNISAGSVFSAGGLTLTPASDFTIDGIRLDLNSTISNTAYAPHVSSVFKFSANTNLFTGTIRFNYNDGLLNGLPEPDLQINIHNGSSWTQVLTNSFDLLNNYVLSGPIASTPLNEITLASVFAVLPLSWGRVDAYRRVDGIAVQWETIHEQQVAWFSVERSYDGLNWKTIEKKIPARNLATKQQYHHTDIVDYPSQLFYRIKQTNADGRAGWSAVAAVNAISQQGKLTAFPNPVQNQVYLENGTGSAIANIQLYNTYGALLKTWFGPQASYQLEQFANGLYYMHVSLKDGSKKQLTIYKQ